MTPEMIPGRRRPPRGVPALAGAALVALLSLPAAARAQALPPDIVWSTLETEHFRVTFPPHLEPLGRHAAERAEVGWTRLAGWVAEPPSGRVDIVVTDHTDISNGSATPFFSNRIVVFAPPPVSHLSLSFTRDWLDMVLVHELAHIFHLDVRWRWIPALRDIFGRVPLPYLFFPAIGSPSWAVEGLATLVESDMTGAGRVHGSYHEMAVRTAILEGSFPGIDRVTGDTPIWPDGDRRYIYGSKFLDWARHRYGEDAVREVVRSTARALIPPQVWFDRVGTNALGVSFTDAYDAWRAELEAGYRALADSLAERGLTPTEAPPLPHRWALHPRVSPDGARLAYSLDDGREPAATALVRLSDVEVERRWRRNGGATLMGPASWLPDGRGLITAQLEFGDPYHLYSDLWLLGPDGERRLTSGLRLTEPAAHPAGGPLLAVQNRAGTNRLVTVDPGGGGVRALTGFDPARGWALPRWSPDGRRIAVGLWRRGGLHDVVVLDDAGALLLELTRDLAVDQAPAWSPDGRWIVFSSDRTGIANLYAYDLDAPAGEPALRQVTRLLGGAFYPDVSPDGRWIWFSAYHADGFHLERVPFDPGAWSPAPSPLADLRAPDDVAVPEPPALPPAAEAARDAPVSDYSAWPTLRPHFWLPLLEPEDGPEGERVAVGVFTAGGDLLGRHGFDVAALWEREEGLLEGSVGYTWARLGNPVLGVRVVRDWDFLLRDTLASGESADLFSREDDLALAATFRRVRWRRFLGLTVGAELADEEIHIRNAPADVDFAEDADPRDRQVGAFARVQLSTVQSQAFSISREDGVSVALGARRRWELDPAPGRDTGYTEATPFGAGYLSFPVAGFADHVLALRGSGLWRNGERAPAADVGGASGVAVGTLAGSVGEGSVFLPVRGFDQGDRGGTRAWSASLEYRFPLALVGRGIGLWPVFLDRVSGALFADGGDAWCSDAQAAIRGGRGCSPAGSPALASVGAELSLDVRLFYTAGLRVRAGVALPVAGADPTAGVGDAPSFHIRLGPSF